MQFRNRASLCFSNACDYAHFKFNERKGLLPKRLGPNFKSSGQRMEGTHKDHHTGGTDSSRASQSPDYGQFYEQDNMSSTSCSPHFSRIQT